MKSSFALRIALVALASCIGSLGLAKEQKDSVVTAVFSRSFNNYQRPVNPDGSPMIQTYVVAKGGYAPGLGADPSIDEVKFNGLVRLLGKYLAKQGYYPAKDPKKADLMLVVHWGKTIPFQSGTYDALMNQGLQGFETMQQTGAGLGNQIVSDMPTDGLPPSAATFGSKQSQDQAAAAVAEAAQDEVTQGMFGVRFAQDMRVKSDEYNANLLGYTGELKERDNPALYAGAGTAYNDLLSDIEAARYYVVLTAYDFQDAVHNNTKKGLWRTVTSIDAQGNRFDEKLVAMVEKASRYFGQDSQHLVRDFQYTPHVSIGDLQILGVVNLTPKSDKDK